MAMPELPEVEVIRRDLEREVVGRKIKAVDVNRLRSIRRHKNSKEFAAALVGAKIRSVGRRGKYLVLRLDGDQALVVHLGMSGQLLRAKSARVAMPKHTHVVLTFTEGGQLRFVDPRTFGEMFVTSVAEIEDKVTELAHLGVDPLEHAMSWEDFGRVITKRQVKLKTLLMDQKFVAGIGNIYSDEILFQAGLRWDRTSDTLSDQEVRRLSRAIIETLNDAVKHRGSSLADQQYVDLFGEPGEFQHHHQVYDREGELCPRCRHPVVRARYSNRSTFFCASCQV
jgi:formamidopyrimidine-DNA glycosylase